MRDEHAASVCPKPLQSTHCNNSGLTVPSEVEAECAVEHRLPHLVCAFQSIRVVLGDFRILRVLRSATPSQIFPRAACINGRVASIFVWVFRSMYLNSKLGSLLSCRCRLSVFLFSHGSLHAV